MEWISNLFGGGAKTPAVPSLPPLPASGNGGSKLPDPSKKDDKKDEDDASGFDPKGFDPRGLERAAKASKELELSPMAGEILALQKEETKAKMFASAKEVEEAKAKQQAFAVERARAEGEERRKSIEYEHQVCLFGCRFSFLIPSTICVAGV
jgi:hypothetical protein